MGYCPMMPAVYNPRNRRDPDAPEYVGQCYGDMCEFWDSGTGLGRCSMVSVAKALEFIAGRLGEDKPAFHVDKFTAPKPLPTDSY